MQLAIAHNPHIKEQKRLWDILDEENKKYIAEPEEEFDELGFELLKQQMAQNPRMIVK